MKRYTESAIILLAVLALVGCSKADEFQHNPDSMLQIASVSGISPFAMMQEPASKAVITGDSLPGDEAAKGIGLFVTASGGGAYDGHDKGYTNVKYTFDGSKWSTQSPIYLSDNDGKLYGYFPYNPDATDLRAIPVESSLNDTDYLYADNQIVNHDNKTVRLQMNHALSRLHLTIKKGENFTADVPLSKITLKSAAIDATGTMDLTTGTITAAKKASETGIVELATDGEITAQGIEEDILIVPADNTEGKKDIAIFLTIDNKATGASLSGESGLDIRSGIQNNVILTIEDTGIKVTGVDVGVCGESGSQMVEAQGHTVTVKLSNDAADAGISDDLIVQVASNGSTVIVKTYSDSGKPLIIREEDGKPLAPVEEGNKSTFTFSDVTKDIIAILAYAKTFKVTQSFKADVTPVSGYFEDYPVQGLGEVLEGKTATVTVPTNVLGYHFENIVCDEMVETGNTIVLKNVSKNLEVVANYKFYDYPLPGVFTVADDGAGNVRKVQFARGNLWYQNGVFHNEDEQYAFSSSDWKEDGHISHFMWCKSTSESVKKGYAEQGSDSDNLFTNAGPTEPNENFAVNGQKGFWRALSGGDNGEWKYLINRNGGTLYKLGVTVCDHANCLILLPDDWKWGENGVGTVWQNEYSESTTVKWSTMEAAGAVCLPAAGWRNSPKSETGVASVGTSGYYWSSTLRNSKLVSVLYFLSDYVNPAFNSERNCAYAVRLVTESK